MRESCYLCASTATIQTHHIDWNHTNDARENRIPLCQRCHALVHKCGYLSRKELIALRFKIWEQDPARFLPPPNDLFH
jgi:hypothetical protein